MHRKTITLTDQQDHWVKRRVKGGHYGNDSEYIRDLIRRDQEYQERIATLRQALIDGENSGAAKPLHIGAVKKAARARPKIAG